MAEVWEALDESLQRPVAVKVILESVSREPSFTERFVREARTIAGLEHPNILPVYDFGQEGESVYLVMPLVPGGSLQDRLGASVTTAAALEWVAGVASALDFAHARGILHRDVKPANILMDKHDRPLLADFGLAKSVSDTSAGLTATGAVIGTPTYMSPEQAMAMTLDGRSDQYALGVIAFQLVAGVVPFSADSPLVVLHKHLQEPPPRPSSLNPRLTPAVDQAIERALRKNPAQRYPCCGDLARALALALGGSQQIDLQATTRWSLSGAPRAATPPPSEEQATVRYGVETAAIPPDDRPALGGAGTARSPRRRSAVFAGLVAVAAMAATFFVWRRLETQKSVMGRDTGATAAAVRTAPPAIARQPPVSSPAPAPATAPAASAPSVNASPAAPGREARGAPARPIPHARSAVTSAPMVRERQPPSTGDIRSRSTPGAPPLTASSDAAWAAAFEDGQSQFRSGNYQEAQKRFREAVAKAETLGPKDKRLPQSLQRLGMVLANLGQIPRAEKLLRSALAMRMEQAGKEDLEVADCQLWLGFVLARQGKASGESEKLILQALATKENALGPNAPAVVFALQQLAYCYEMQGRHDEAETRLKRALSILDTASGDNNALHAGVLNDLGWTYQRKGEPALAEPAFRKALALRQKALAPGHPLIAVSQFGLAGAEIELKKYSEAESLLKQSLAIRERSLGPDHPQVAATLRELARLLRLDHREAEAEQYQARARAIRARRQEEE